MTAAPGSLRPIKEATAEKQEKAKDFVPETLQYFKVSQSLDKASMSLFAHFAAAALPCSYVDMSADTADRDSKVALLTRLEREFSEDDERACRVDACNLWRSDDDEVDEEGHKEIKAAEREDDEQEATATMKPLMEVFRNEWFRVKSHPRLTGNQRNGFLLRVEERAAYRFLLRIVQTSLVSEDRRPVGDPPQSSRPPSRPVGESLLRRLRGMGNITWTGNATTAGTLEGDGEEEEVAENDGGGDDDGDDGGEDDSKGQEEAEEVLSGSEEVQKRKRAEDAAVEAAVEAELVEQEVLAEVVAEVAAGGTSIHRSGHGSGIGNFCADPRRQRN